MNSIIPSPRRRVASPASEITPSSTQLLDVSIDYATGEGRQVNTVHGVLSDLDAEQLRQAWRDARAAEDTTTVVTVPARTARGVAEVAVQVPAASIRLIVTTPSVLRRQSPPAIPPAARRPEQPIAANDWHTAAEVEVTETVDTHNAIGGTRTFTAGERLVMHQWGRAGRPVDRDVWWTSYDIDAAHIVPAGHVRVTRILDETYPTMPTGGDL